jgi:16S rRNA (cytosine967-C5)-methyltransferase
VLRDEMSRDFERTAHLQALKALEDYDRSTSIRSVLRKMDRDSWISTEAQPVMHSLTLGVVRFLNTIDFILLKVVGSRRLSEMSSHERSSLRLAVYETRWLQTPIEIITEDYLGSMPHLVPFVSSAVSLDLQKSTRNLKPVERLSISLAHPSFVVRTLLDNLPRAEAISLMEHNNAAHDYYVRPNALKSGNEDVISSLSHYGAELESDPDVQRLYRVNRGIKSIVGSKEFKDGEVLIQDKASVLTVITLNPLPGETVWDACASPGMKTQLICELMKQKGHVVATDIYSNRARMGRERCELLGCEEVEWVQADACKSPVSGADKILVDAPCTSTGVLRSHPSFKWRLNKARLLAIMSVQNKILDGVLTAYTDKPGTEIVYATCSLLPHEGESQIDSAMLRHKFDLLQGPVPNSPGYPNFKCSQKVCRLFPHRHATSGFFIAHLRITR